MGLFRRSGDVPNTDLVVYQQAAGTVTQLFMDLERLKQDLATAQSHPWLASTEYQHKLIACWLALVCHAGASQMLEASRLSYHRDVLPERVVSFIAAVFELGRSWETNAKQILTSKTARLDARLPVRLPADQANEQDLIAVDVEIWAALVEIVKREADALMGEIGYASRFPNLGREFRLISDRFDAEYRRLEAEVEPQLDLWRAGPTGVVRQKVYHELKRLAGAYLVLGQWLLQPELLDPSFKVKTVVNPIDPLNLRVPQYNPHLKTTKDLQGRLKLGFDPWTLTASIERAKRERDTASLRQLEEFWLSNPTPDQTLALHQAMEAQVQAGTVRHRTGEAIRECPWGPVYTALQTLAIAGERIGAGEMFAFHPGMMAGRFVHRLRRLGQDSSVQSGKRLASYQPGQPAPSPSSAADPAIWFMTDPDVARQRSQDPASIQQLTQLWAADPRLRVTRRIQDQLINSEQAGVIRRRPGETGRNCPWPSSFTALQDTQVAGERLSVGEIFILTAQLESGKYSLRLIRLGRDTSVVPSKRKLRPYQP